MTDYTKLVKALRFETDHVAVEQTMRDAAAAIEALQAEVERLELDNEDYEHEHRRLKGEIEALQAEKKKTVTQIYYEEQMEWEGRCRDLMYWIADLQEQLPKRGKWIHDVVTSGTTAGGVTYEHHYTCSVCGGLMGRKGDKFCYNCGAEMFASDTNIPNKNDTMDGPIITPCRGCSDYDGYGGCKSKGGCVRAKMEAQE